MDTRPTREHSILVVGSLNIDLVLELPRMPQVGESLMGSRYTRVPGGKGGNQAVALQRLGARVTFVGSIGDDADGVTLLKGLQSEGILTHFVTKDLRNRTGLAVIFLDEARDNLIAVLPGANQHLKRSDIRDAFESSLFEAVLIQLEVPDEVVFETCEIAKEKGIPVFLDAGPAKDFALERVAELEVLSPNETEVLALTGIRVNSIGDANLAAERLLVRTRCKAVVLKLGASGAFLRTAGGVARHFPAFAVDPLDPTAAGDAFTAGLTLRYLDTGNFEEAVNFANAVGALATTKLGAQTSLPTASEVGQFYWEGSARV